MQVALIKSKIKILQTIVRKKQLLEKLQKSQ